MEKIRDYYPVYEAASRRCGWATEDLLVAYHDNEYGVIKMNDNSIFEQICLTVLCSGRITLSVIERREELKEALRGYDIAAVSNLTDSNIKAAAKKLALPYSKLSAARTNAEAAGRIIAEHGSLFKFIYAIKQPERLLFALKSYGFTQIGIVTVTGIMKSLGIIEAHDKGCYMRTVSAEEQ